MATRGSESHSSYNNSAMPSSPNQHYTPGGGSSRRGRTSFGSPEDASLPSRSPFSSSSIYAPNPNQLANAPMGTDGYANNYHHFNQSELSSSRCNTLSQLPGNGVSQWPTNDYISSPAPATYQNVGIPFGRQVSSGRPDHHLHSMGYPVGPSPAPSETAYSSSSSEHTYSIPRGMVSGSPTISAITAPSPAGSEGDGSSSLSSDEYGSSTGASPAYSSHPFISSPYEKVSWPVNEVTLATRSVQEAAKRRRKRPARFHCELCPTSFTAKHNLENHMNSHRNIRPHKCNLGCGKAFGTAQVLRRHEPKCKGGQAS